MPSWVEEKEKTVEEEIAINPSFTRKVQEEVSCTCANKQLCGGASIISVSLGRTTSVIQTTSKENLFEWIFSIRFGARKCTHRERTLIRSEELFFIASSRRVLFGCFLMLMSLTLVFCSATCCSAAAKARVPLSSF